MSINKIIFCFLSIFSLKASSVATKKIEKTICARAIDHRNISNAFFCEVILLGNSLSNKKVLSISIDVSDWPSEKKITQECLFLKTKDIKTNKYAYKQNLIRKSLPLKVTKNLVCQYSNRFTSGYRFISFKFDPKDHEIGNFYKVEVKINDKEDVFFWPFTPF